MLEEVIPPVGTRRAVETPVYVFKLVKKLRKLDLESPNLFYGLSCSSLAGNDI